VIIIIIIKQSAMIAGGIINLKCHLPFLLLLQGYRVFTASDEEVEVVYDLLKDHPPEAVEKYGQL